VSATGGFTLDLFSFLFGSILLVSVNDTLAILALAGVVLATVILLYKKLMYITFDEEQAKVSGLDIMRINYLFVVLASVTAVVSMRLVGILLVSALIVIPNITALLFGRGFKKTAIISVSVSVFSVLAGIAISYAFNLAPAGTIVLVSAATFVAALAAKYATRRQVEEVRA
jgi:zinc transport system permease protein